MKNKSAKHKSKTLKPFWVIFLKDPLSGVISGVVYGHNATADYKNNRYYLGTEKIEIDISKFE